MARIERLSVCRATTYDPDAHTVEWVMNSGERDSYGERLLGSGHELAKHVNVIDHHYYGGATVEALLGVVERSWAEKEATIGLLRFGNDHPRMIAAEKMVASGILQNSSVGADIIAYRDGDDGDEVVVPEDWSYWPHPGRVFTKWKALELSMVGVPADEGAVARMIKACDEFGKIKESTPLPLHTISGGEDMTDRVREVLQKIGLLDDVEAIRREIHELRKESGSAPTPPLTIAEKVFGRR